MPPFARDVAAAEPWSSPIGYFQPLSDVPYRLTTGEPTRRRLELSIPRSGSLSKLVAAAKKVFSEPLGARLVTLINIKRTGDERRIRSRSVRNALRFVFEQGWPEPEIVVAPSGNLQAYWRLRDSGQLVAQFLPNSYVWFFLSKGGQRRLTGLLPMDEFVSKVKWDEENLVGEETSVA